MHAMFRSLVWPAIGLMACTSPISAPLRAQLPTVAPAPASGAPAITRTDIAAAYRNVQLATAGRVLPGDSTADLNRRVDAATIAFRGGRTVDGLRALHEAAADFGNTPAARTAARQLAALRVTLAPRVLIRGRVDGEPRVVIAPLYAVAPPAHATIGDSVRGTVRFTRGDQLVTELSFAIATGSLAPRSFPAPGESLRRIDAGRIALATTAAPRPPPRADDGRWFTTTRSPDDVRVDLLRKAEVLDTLLPFDLMSAAATLRARARGVTAEPIVSLRTPFTDNPVALARDIEAEFELLVTGGNPYANRYGDLWRIVRLPNAVVPVRLFVPLDVARARRPAPLVIALHDEGGDENTFPDVFGRIVGLAESSGVVVVSVNSDLFSGSGDDFNGIVAAIQADVTIDVARIYVIGHGRGAEQATTLAATRASLIAGVACIAGFGRVPTGRAVAPMLVILGEIDPISATEQLTPPITEAISGGASLDVRVVPNQGHTLIVNAMLPTVVEWLLRQTRPRAR